MKKLRFDCMTFVRHKASSMSTNTLLAHDVGTGKHVQNNAHAGVYSMIHKETN